MSFLWFTCRALPSTGRVWSELHTQQQTHKNILWSVWLHFFKSLHIKISHYTIYCYLECGMYMYCTQVSSSVMPNTNFLHREIVKHHYLGREVIWATLLYFDSSYTYYWLGQWTYFFTTSWKNLLHTCVILSPSWNWYFVRYSWRNCNDVHPNTDDHLDICKSKSSYENCYMLVWFKNASLHYCSSRPKLAKWCNKRCEPC